MGVLESQSWKVRMSISFLSFFVGIVPWLPFRVLASSQCHLFGSFCSYGPKVSQLASNVQDTYLYEIHMCMSDLQARMLGLVNVLRTLCHMSHVYAADRPRSRTNALLRQVYHETRTRACQRKKQLKIDGRRSRRCHMCNLRGSC
jgi:hypothetical protein